jgi:hypothetical protein
METTESSDEESMEEIERKASWSREEGGKGG